MTPPPAEVADQSVRLRPLSLVDEGDQVLVGDPQVGTFVAIPAVGGVVLRALQRGAAIGEAARAAEEFAGEPVDVSAFVATLRELGFVDDRPDGTDQPERLPGRVSAIQGRRWLYGLRPELARPLFGRVAWVCYGGAALFSLGTLAVAHDRLWPEPSEDAFVFTDIGLSGLFFVPFVTLLAALHESWHWLAARALGVPARFGVDRRMVFLVFETDLSRLWALPRRQRYSPILAGLAFDSVVLSAVLIARLAVTGGRWSPPEPVAAVLALCVFVLVFRIGWQCMIFLRTDLYAVLLVATGCRNLWRVKSLLLRRALGRLTPAQADELAAADPTDVRVGSWFRWVWLAGLLAVTAWSLLFLAPVIVTVLTWAADGVVLGPAQWRFWYHAAATAVILGPWLMVAFLAVRGLVRRLAARTGSARRVRDQAPGLVQISGPDQR